MIKLIKQDKESVIRQVQEGKIDAIALSRTNIVDEIILTMHKNGITECLKRGFEDKRRDNASIPFEMIFLLSIAAKMKVHTSLTDIPYAISDHRTLGELGYTLSDADGKINKGFMREGTIRLLLGKYTMTDFINGYNNTVQNYILPQMKTNSNIHILDCTEVKVNYTNENYENSTIVKDGTGRKCRGYKLSTIRGIAGDSGVIEDIRFGPINVHDLSLSRDMILTTPVLKRGDILINDRGFMSREVMNSLKSERGVDTYIPLRIKMQSYDMAIYAAKEENTWVVHPNKARKNQKISLVTDLGPFWESDKSKNDVPLNACVIWFTDVDNYAVIVTTDTSKTAKQIVQTYELRTEVEEDYRQLKDFWKLENFRSRKLHMIGFHIVSVLLGYLFFQLYTMLPEGEQYAHKSLPVILKNYTSKEMPYYIFYSGDLFAVLDTIEFAELYGICNPEAKLIISLKLIE